MKNLGGTGVPHTELAEYFDKLPTSRSDRLARALELVAAPDQLPGMFVRSRERFAEWQSDEPFYPKPRTLSVEHGRELSRTEDVQARLAGRWHVEGDEQLDFVYLDRELLLARNTVGDKVERGIEVDLLLANANNRTPILAEIKISKPGSMNTDKDPFYALVQLLAAAAQAASTSQLERLRKHLRPEFPILNMSQLDLYIFAVNETRATHWQELRDCTEKLVRSLMGEVEVSNWIRRIALIRVFDEKPSRSLRIVKDFAFTASD